MLSRILADGVIFVHLAYVAFAVVGQVLILIGLALRWQWVRNLRFRVVHLVMVEVVALEGWFNIRCPLTDVEAVLRAGIRSNATLVATLRMNHTPGVQTETAANDDDAASEFQPVFQQTNPEPVAPQQPEQKSEPASDGQLTDSSETFVGRLLGAVLYVQVAQATLDLWYVGFGVVSLVIFVAFPPRRGAWSKLGFSAMVLLWIGSIFFAATLYDWLVGHSIADPYPPLVTGAGMILAGGGCGLKARRHPGLQPQA